MSIVLRCDECDRSFETKKGILITHLQTTPHYKIAQSCVEEEQKNMISTEEGKKASTAAETSRSKISIEIIDRDNISDLDTVGTKIISNDDTFSER